MLPWLAHGHISPFLELAKKLIKRNVYIYFCSTAVNLSSIKDQISEESFHSIQLVELHLPSFPDLPPHYHTTKSLPPHLIPTLRKALDMAEPTVSTILKLLNPHLLIYDFFQPWAPVIASAQNIPAILFNTTGAATFCFSLHHMKNPGVEFPSPFLHFEEHEIRRNTQLLESSAGSKDTYRKCIEKSSDIILMKTFREIEAKYLDYLTVLYEKKPVPVGVLVQDPIYENNQSEFIQWLSKKEKSSAVFVSFGSECILKKEEMEEIAHGLELSSINFIWAIKFPKGEKSRIDEALPQGFLERVGERGMVVEGWAPQTKILQHSSIGGFVSHCGWSSVVEGMRYGVPIIAMPIHLDQPLNARMAVEIGVGVEVKREKDGRLERGEVAKVIREVVLEKEGEEVRRKAKEMGGKIGMKGEEEIDVLLEELMLLSRPLSPVVQVTRTVAVPVQEEQQGATIAADIVAPTQTVVAPTVAAPVSLRRSSRDRRSAMSSDYEVYLNEVAGGVSFSGEVSPASKHRFSC
ncbi:hypothetical protein HHK36_016793 [Tetracentron sinense]|uniref:Glycosyltransferase n=1 Tax=Tetracentron sinense TaxID=13715 RepID=A0A834Z426_TETSI|nr:hypothetical protein HHK36_016793 [Tetracentron sinense]